MQSGEESDSAGAAPTAASFTANEETISQQGFGDAWPFTVERGTLRGEVVGHTSKGQIIAEVTLSAEGRIYGVNGIARGSHKYADVANIWANDTASGLKKDMGPIIKRGVNLAKSSDQISNSAQSVSTARDVAGSRWYDGGTLHYKTIREWRRAHYADKLATCADCISLLSSNGVLDRQRFQFATPDSVKPYAERMVGLIDAAISNGSVTIDGSSMKIDDSRKVYEVLNMVVIENGWD